MIDPKPLVECEYIETAIMLVHEKDFLAVAQRPENAAYRMVHYEYHPNEEKDQVIAHHFYVADAPSKQIFGFLQLTIPEAEYVKIQDEFDE